MAADPKKEGIDFEALTYSALQEIGYEVHWGIKPKGFAIDPDFILGPLESPSHWILVTSTGSSKEFDKKFWRNLSEIVLAKTNFKSPPILVNLVFRDNQKIGLREAMSELCDVDVHVLRYPFGSALVDAVGAASEDTNKDKQLKVATIRNMVATQTIFRKLYEKFRLELKKRLSQNAVRHVKLWNLVASDKRIATNFSLKATSLRRGIAKLLVVPETYRQIFFNQAKSGGLLKPGYPKLLEELEFVTAAVGGARVEDPDLLSTVENFDWDDIHTVIQLSPLERMSRWIRPLQDLGDVVYLGNWVAENIDVLETPQGMLNALVGIHANPYFGIEKSKITGALETVWLFYLIIDLAKSFTGKRQGFGLGALGTRAQRFLTSAKWPPSSRVWTIVTSDYVNRVGSEVMPDDVLMAEAGVLSEILSEMGKDGLKEALTGIKQMTIVSNLEQKLIHYPLFEPLQILIDSTLRKHKIPFKRVKVFATMIGELVGKPNKVGTTGLFETKHTLIYWRSAPKNPRDKTKELCGKGYAIRLAFQNGTFNWRLPKKNLILVLDGSFTSGQVAMLHDSGWDRVLFASDYGQLGEVIKSFDN